MTTHTGDLTNLTHESRTERARAAMALGAARDHSAADALVERLGVEEDAFVRENLTWATVQVIDAALPAVVAALSSDHALARRQAAHVLSKVGGAALAPHVVGVIADADPDVAVKAYRAAANTGDPSVVAPLTARLGDGAGEQRDALTSALQRLAPLAVPALVGALGDPDADVREHAADTLAHIGSPDADAAADALTGLLGDDSERVRLAAVLALGQLDSDASVAGLRAASENTDARVSAVASRLLSDRPAVAG